MTLRIILTRRGCPFCLKAIKAGLAVNRRLPDLERIAILDNYEWEEMRLKAHPIVDALNPKTFDGYPHVSIDGQEVEACETDLMIISIAKLVEEDLISPITVGTKTIG